MKDMPRCRFLPPLVLLAAFTIAVPAQGQSPSQPNIIFLLADDWGWGDLGSYGNERIRTPHIDGLAREGLRFTQFYQGAAVCSPSRASCMTGLFTTRHGVHSHMQDREGNRRRGMTSFLDPDLPMLPRLLKQAGYATAHFGKWHLTSTDDPGPPRPPAYGFDAHRLTVGEGSALHLQPATILGWNSWPDARPGPHWEAWRAESSFRIIDETISFIRAHRQQPFYVQAWLYDTHAVLSPTAGQMKPFSDIPMPYRIYYSAVFDTDRQVGRLLAALDEMDLVENTLVIFSSDNGPENLELYEASAHGVGNPGPFRGRKRSGYEGGIRLPFIVRWPKAAPAGTVDSTTILSAVDLLPTLCALAGARVPRWPEIDGQNMESAFRGQPTPRDRPLYWFLQEDAYRQGPLIDKSPKLIIREGDWKLLMRPDGSGIELYDLSSNSLEVDNLAESRPEVKERLVRRLLQWKEDPQQIF